MFLKKMYGIKEDLMKKEKLARVNVFEKFKNNSFSIISEIKKASPSKGDINPNADIIKIAEEYIENGATAISILTETEYFKGKIEDLKSIREKYPEMILLRKDFIIDEYQIYEAKIAGADMILLILAMTGYEKTKELATVAKNLGLEVLLEIHTEEEMQQALTLDTNFIGVNNRNLKTLEVSLDVSRELSKYITEDKIFVCESGITSADEINEMRELGYKAFLIGSHFMGNENQGEELRKLING